MGRSDILGIGSGGEDAGRDAINDDGAAMMLCNSLGADALEVIFTESEDNMAVLLIALALYLLLFQMPPDPPLLLAKLVLVQAVPRRRVVS